MPSRKASRQWRQWVRPGTLHARNRPWGLGYLYPVPRSRAQLLRSGCRFSCFCHSPYLVSIHTTYSKFVFVLSAPNLYINSLVRSVFFFVTKHKTNIKNGHFYIDIVTSSWDDVRQAEWSYCKQWSEILILNANPTPPLARWLGGWECHPWHQKVTASHGCCSLSKIQKNISLGGNFFKKGVHNVNLILRKHQTNPNFPWQSAK